MPAHGRHCQWSKRMKALNLITLIIVIIGGLNWGLVGLADVDLVATLFGGRNSILSTIVYLIVGLSALYQIYPLTQAVSEGEILAESGRYSDPNLRR
jgi:hypothetical protein